MQSGRMSKSGPATFGMNRETREILGWEEMLDQLQEQYGEHIGSNTDGWEKYYKKVQF